MVRSDVCPQLASMYYQQSKEERKEKRIPTKIPVTVCWLGKKFSIVAVLLRAIVRDRIVAVS